MGERLKINEELYRLADLIARAENPQLFFDLDIPEIEKNVLVNDLEWAMEDLLEEVKKK